MRAEPRLRVLFVRIGHETRIGQEVTAGPLPDIAEHLSAAEGTIPIGEGCDIDAAERPAVQVGAAGSGRFIAPGKTSLALAESSTAGRRLSGSGHLPFSLGRQAAAGPAAISIRLVPVDMKDRPVELERKPLIEVAPLPPLAGQALPVLGM